MARLSRATDFFAFLVLLGAATLAWAPSSLKAGSSAGAAPATLSTAPAGAEPGVLEAEDETPAQAPEADAAAPEPAVDAYDQVEKAGEVASAGEFRADGWIDHFQSGYIFGRKGGIVLLRLRHAGKSLIGTDYSVFRDEGAVGGQEGGAVVGDLWRCVGVLRVMRVDRDGVAARVVQQYADLVKGDALRLREAQRLKYYALLDHKPAKAPKALKGEVIGMLPPALFAVSGDVVYLNVGLRKGVVPGMRLTVLGDADAAAFGEDDIDSKMPARPIQPLSPPSDDLDTVAPTGVVATLEVLNATRGACAARVLNCVDDVRLGDPVRTP